MEKIFCNIIANSGFYGMSKNWLFCPISVQNISDWKFDLLLGDFGFRQNVGQGPLALFWYKSFDGILSISWVILVFPETFFTSFKACFFVVFKLENWGNDQFYLGRYFKEKLNFQIFRAILTGVWGLIQGDILFTKNINVRYRVIGTNCKKSAIYFQKFYDWLNSTCHDMSRR